ncbi:uncharacterized protein C8Q71DRAFT_253644 [Rhodofomes roseus]|uniref:Uncharacterized protein n=1 Tax=Rhodofomes roseus TaxID=34475 RepID=A0ABQ8K5W1_9APHY|nr:uncharacterized protein C8Q71DRAFT_253644 [Rhodofomes roseus]KAH9832474.1 hypothetical protein C8Q71DRAFT_253644 [Rhodofomes roseus]
MEKAHARCDGPPRCRLITSTTLLLTPCISVSVPIPAGLPAFRGSEQLDPTRFRCRSAVRRIFRGLEEPGRLFIRLVSIGLAMQPIGVLFLGLSFFSDSENIIYRQPHNDDLNIKKATQRPVQRPPLTPPQRHVCQSKQWHGGQSPTGLPSDSISAFLASLKHQPLCMITIEQYRLIRKQAETARRLGMSVGTDSSGPLGG